MVEIWYEGQVFLRLCVCGGKHEHMDACVCVVVVLQIPTCSNLGLIQLPHSVP